MLRFAKEGDGWNAAQRVTRDCVSVERANGTVMGFFVVVGQRTCALDYRRMHLDHVGVGGSALRGIYVHLFSLVFDRRRRLSPWALGGDDLDPVYGFPARMDCGMSVFLSCLFANFDAHRGVASCDCIPPPLHLLAAGHHHVQTSLRVIASSDDRDSHPKTQASCSTAG